MIELLLTMTVVMLIFWLMIIRPTRKRESELARLVGSLSAGQTVMTTSGLLGVVRAIDSERVSLEVSPGVIVDFVPRAVSRVLPADAPVPGLLRTSPAEPYGMEPGGLEPGGLASGAAQPQSTSGEPPPPPPDYLPSAELPSAELPPAELPPGGPGSQSQPNQPGL